MTESAYNELLDWLTKNDLKDDKTWRRNRVGILLKSQINSAGHWKSLPRGNPAKGKRAQEASLSRKGSDEA